MRATDLLREDHQKVKGLFEAFEQQPSEAEKGRIVREALTELEVHTQIEEELFYPPVRQRIRDGELMDEADEEHKAAERLIRELKGMRPGQSHYDAKFTVLAEMVKHHIEEEESQMLPKAEASGLDLEKLGEQLAARKSQLLQRKAQAAGAGNGHRPRRARAASSRRSARRKPRALAHAGR